MGSAETQRPVVLRTPLFRFVPVPRANIILHLSAVLLSSVHTTCITTAGRIGNNRKFVTMVFAERVLKLALVGNLFDFAFHRLLNRIRASYRLHWHRICTGEFWHVTCFCISWRASDIGLNWLEGVPFVACYESVFRLSF